MDRPTEAAALPKWLAYVRAMLFAFVILLAGDWAAYVIGGGWLHWPFLVPLAIAWPFAMTAIT